MQKSHLLEKFPEVIHGLSTAADGNMSLKRGESQEVLKNRKRYCLSLGIHLSTVVTARQVHGVRIFEVGTGDIGSGAFSLENNIGEGDALYTGKTGVTLGVQIADCVPVFLYDPVRSVIALAHAGWRSASGGIVSRLLKRLDERYGSRPEDFYVWVGPCIGQCCFEVGNEVVKAFEKPSLVPPEKQKWCQPKNDEEQKAYIDLKRIIRHQLESLGIPSTQIEIAVECTRCNENYFSYRRTGEETGQMLALLALS